jgi:hypothetical protein
MNADFDVPSAVVVDPVNVVPAVLDDVVSSSSGLSPSAYVVS